MIIQELKVELPHAEDYSMHLLAVDEGVVLGTLRLENFSEPGLWVGLLFVEPAWRGQGIGAQLLERAEAIGARLNKSALCLTVHEENLAAQRFYSREGFVPFTKSHEKYVQWILPLGTYSAPSYAPPAPAAAPVVL